MYKHLAGLIILFLAAACGSSSNSSGGPTKANSSDNSTSPIITLSLSDVTDLSGQPATAPYDGLIYLYAKTSVSSYNFSEPKLIIDDTEILTANSIENNQIRFLWDTSNLKPGSHSIYVRSLYGSSFIQSSAAEFDQGGVLTVPDYQTDQDTAGFENSKDSPYSLNKPKIVVNVDYSDIGHIVTVYAARSKYTYNRTHIDTEFQFNSNFIFEPEPVASIQGGVVVYEKPYPNLTVFAMTGLRDIGINHYSDGKRGGKHGFNKKNVMTLTVIK